MPDRQKSPIGIWIAAALVLLLVVYPLSIGPVVFVLTLIWPAPTRPDWADNAVFLIYLPVYLLTSINKDLFGETLRLYVRWWTDLAR